MKRVTTNSEDWMTVKSKTHPDRVYYFNKKTNKASWIPPNNVNESPIKMSKIHKKRKNDEEDLMERDKTPITPKIDRPKLKAKRILPSKTNDDLSANNHSNETPQMKALRQKILEKKMEKINNLSKKQKSTIPTTFQPKIPKKLTKIVKKEEKSDDEPAESMTSQMREIYEKLKERKSLVGTKKSSEPVKKEKLIKIEENQEVKTRSRSRAKSIGPSSIINEPTVSDKRRRTMFISSIKSVRKKSESDTETSTIIENEELKSNSEKFNITPSSKKNLAQQRLDKLRRSLKIENKKEDSPQPKKLKKLQQNTICQENPKILQRENHQNHEETENSMILTDETDSPTIPQFSKDYFPEAMDWEPIQDEIIMQEIQLVRNELASDIPEIQMEELPQENSLDLVDGHIEINRRALYIVIDTNVFLSNIEAVEQARDSVFKTHGRPIIVIPWTVIRELDYIKDDKSNTRPENLKLKSRQAVRFLNQHFSSKHPRILGQTIRDVINNRKLFSSECPDDEILQTCLQIKKSYNSVVLLSYDKNLCNKAMIHDIATLGRNDPFEKIDYLIESEYRQESLFSCHLNQTGDNPKLPTSSNIKEIKISEDLYEEIKIILNDFLTVIVAKEMKNLYGENWEKYTIIKPPWTTLGVLKCAIKHWMAAINDSFVRSAEFKLKELHDLINKYEFNRKLNHVGYIIDLTYDLVQCLIINKHENLIKRVTITIEELKKKYNEIIDEIHEESITEKMNFKENEKELEIRASAVFKNFETIYGFSRDICGAACQSIGMSCSFNFRKLEKIYNDDFFINLQPEIAGNLNRLLLILSTALENLNILHKDHKSVLALHNALQNFCPHLDNEMENISPIDVFACLKIKEKNLKLGVPQLQELSDHFCRLAAFRCR